MNKEQEEEMLKKHHEDWEKEESEIKRLIEEERTLKTTPHDLNAQTLKAKINNVIENINKIKNKRFVREEIFFKPINDKEEEEEQIKKNAIT
jgi:SpoVK/Ycf46/Vps4 family AAA+-type ATPase